MVYEKKNIMLTVYKRLVLPLVEYSQAIHTDTATNPNHKLNRKSLCVPSYSNMCTVAVSLVAAYLLCLYDSAGQHITRSSLLHFNYWYTVNVYKNTVLHTTTLQPFYDPLSGTTQVSRYQKKHLPTHLS